MSSSLVPLQVRARNLCLVLGLIVCLSVPALADDKWSVQAALASGVKTMTSYPGGIKIAAKKNDAAAPDGTKVTLTRISGDAQLFDPATSKLGSTVDVTTTGGNGTATLYMQANPEAFFSVTVFDATNVSRDTAVLQINAGDLEASGAAPCAVVRVTDEIIPATATQEAITLKADDRCRTGVWLYTGMVLDSFAAKELNKYFNPNDANDLKTSFIAGIDVEQYLGRNNWLFLETVNGVRSIDVDCTASPTVEVCSDKTPTNDQFLYILRNARTLEAFLGFRHEFGAGDNNGRFYLKTQLGFLDVAGSGTDIVDSHTFLAGGYLSIDDRFADSYVEVGFGKSDIFDSYENRRFKFDGFLTAPLAGSNSTQWFLQMTVDSDFRSGPDSIQIYMGLDFDLRQLSLRF
jgi:hypothetical protein